MLLLFKNQITNNLSQPKILREQHCMTCKSVLAMELTDKMGFGGEYYIAADCIYTAGLPDILYKKKKWFGEFIRCPICGRTGRLPVDKPYSWEMMNEKEKYANRNKKN